MSKIPKLRFKEFSGEWESKKLGDISDIYDGTHQTPKYTDSGVKFVSVENINNIYKDNKYISEEDYNKNFKIKPQLNDIFMTRITAGEIGATAIVDREENLAYYVSVALIRAYNEKVNALFLAKYISSKYFKRELNKRIIHVAFPKKINLGDIGDCGTKLPNLQEQEKIASFFSLIDDKISLQSEKIEALKDYKKGMMQKIFSQELRFKDENGEDYPEWEEKKLGDLVDDKRLTLDRGCVISKSELNGGFPVYSSSVKNNGLMGYSSKYMFEEPRITWSIDGGGNFFYRDAHKYSVTNVSGILNVLDCNINMKYLYYNLSIEHTKKVFDYQIKAHPSVISKMYIVSLPSYFEQEKIASLLSTIDKKIELEKEKLDALQEYKKALLQQMFI